LVDSELLAEEKSFVTDGALERLVSAVCQAVLSQCALVDERVSTDITSVRTFARVHADVTQ